MRFDDVDRDVDGESLHRCTSAPLRRRSFGGGGDGLSMPEEDLLTGEDDSPVQRTFALSALMWWVLTSLALCAVLAAVRGVGGQAITIGGLFVCPDSASECGADAVARASWNGLLEVVPERRRRPVRCFSTFSLLQLLLN